MSHESQPWAVMTWNVHGSARPAIADLATAIDLEAPDVLAIQEIRRGQAAGLAATLTMRYSWVLKHYPYSHLVRGRAEGMAIFTRHALAAAGHTRISDRASTLTWRRRIAQWALVGRADGSAVRVYNLHLSPHDDASARRIEALRVTEIAAGHGNDAPSVVAGDFNDGTDPTIVFALPGIEHLVPPFTSPADAPYQLIDHVLLPPRARDVSVTVPAGGPDWAAISDHLPVTVRFSLDAAA